MMLLTLELLVHCVAVKCLDVRSESDNISTMVKLYKTDVSPPARSVMMCCEIFNVPYEPVEVNLLEGDHRSSEYMKKNPTHRVPVLEDEDLVIHDSNAIIAYLADAYGKTDAWYPKDIKKRALVNQKLFFNIEILFGRLRNITYFAIIEGERKVPQYKLDEIREAYDFMEQFLTKNKYLAMDTITIADVAAFANVSSLVHIIPIDAVKYPKLTAWLKEMTNQSFAKKCNEAGAKIIGDLIKKYVDL